MRYTANSKIQKNCSFFFIEANQFLIIACTERLSHRGEINRLNYIRFSCTVFPVRTVIFPTGSIEKSSKFRISMRWAFPHLISSPQLFYRLLHQEIIHLRYGFFSFSLIITPFTKISYFSIKFPVSPPEEIIFSFLKIDPAEYNLHIFLFFHQRPLMGVTT